LKEFYRRQGKLHEIYGEGSIDDIFAAMEKVIDSFAQ